MTGIPVAVNELVGVDYLNEVARAHYRKTTSKAVNTTVSPTDLLNGEITIGAGAVSTVRGLRATLWGDWLQNSGASQKPPRFQLVVGGTTVLDTSVGASGFNIAAAATRAGWRCQLEMLELGATNSQLWSMALLLAPNSTSGWQNGGAALFATGEGAYTIPVSATGGATAMAEALGINTSAIDMTVAQTFAFNVINGVSNASYETKLLGAIVEVV